MSNRFTSAMNRILSKSSSSASAFPVGSSNFIHDSRGSSNETLDYLVGRKNKEYLDFLRDSDYSFLLVNCFAQPLKEMLDKSSPIVHIVGELESKEDYVNNQLENLNIIKDITDNLFDYVYYGGRFVFLHNNKDQDRFRILSLDDECQVARVSKMGEPIAFNLMSGEDSTTISKEKGIWCSFKDKYLRSVTLKDYLDSPKLTDSQKLLRDEIKGDISFNYLDDKISRYIRVLDYHTWTSDFESQAYLLFKIWLCDLYIQLLNTKDTLKQDLLVATFNDKGKKVANIAEISQKIESVVNASSSLSLNEDPESLINSIMNSFQSSFRVLPTIQDFSQIGKLDLGNASERLAKLSELRDNLNNELLGSLGIPSEILSPGVASRWDILSRSDRYLNSITAYLNGISYYVRSAARAIINSKGHEISLDDIKFDITNSTGVQSQMSRTKLLNFNEELQASAQSIQSAFQLMQTPFYNSEAVIDEFLQRARRDGFPFANALDDPQSIIQKLTEGQGQ